MNPISRRKLVQAVAAGVVADNVQGAYTCMGHFQSLDGAANTKFVSALKAKYRAQRVTGDVLECAHTAVYLWKAAVEKAKRFDVEKVVAASSGLEFDAPEGKVKCHAANHHLWKYARIGEYGSDGQVKMIYQSALIEPNPMAKF